LLTALAPVVSAGNLIDCTFSASKHKVKITIHGDHNVELERGGNGTILVNSIPCVGSPGVFNTDSIAIFAGAGHQVVTIFLGNGGFKPGFTDEPGTSDEIEISVSLGGDNDLLALMGNTSADKITIGKSNGFAVQGRINLNSGEATGIDADLTMILGIEDFFVFGKDGGDTVSANGGAGTGGAAEFDVHLDGGKGGDSLTGGTQGDHLYGGPDADVLSGGAGPDNLDSTDGVHGNDQIFGGAGADSCTFDSGDSTTSC